MNGYKDPLVRDFKTFLEVSTKCILIEKGLHKESDIDYIDVAMDYMSAIGRYVESFKNVKYSWTTSSTCYDSEGKQYLVLHLKHISHRSFMRFY